MVRILLTTASGEATEKQGMAATPPLAENEA